MPTLELTPEQTEILRETLASYLSDLRMEIADTERLEMREALKRKEAELKAILARLGDSG